MKRTSVTVTMALALPLLFGSGCASLIIRPADSVRAKTGKFTARFLIGVSTLGISEFGMVEVKRTDAKERRLNEFYAYLDESLGIMTVDAAVSKWGPPTSQFNGDKVLVLEWNKDSTSPIMVPVGDIYIIKPRVHESKLQLSFDTSTGMLSDWKHHGDISGFQ